MPGRALRPLIVAWVVTLALEGATAVLARHSTFWAPLLEPIRIVLLAPGLVASWGWLRPRRRRERRRGERRQHTRRTEEPED